MNRHQPIYNISDNSYSDSESDSNSKAQCTTCLVEYNPHDFRICKDCCDGINKVPGELRKEIDDLKAKVNFLRLPQSFLVEGNSRSFFDIVLIAYDNGVASPPLLAHKAILVNRSRVFEAMLESEMVESHNNVIKISDVTYDILQNFVNYLYKAEVSNLDEPMAYDLLIMSEKYQVKHLKSYCEKFLITKLSSEKALMGYVFAHQYNAKRLLSATLLLILDNMELLTKAKEYKDLVKRHSILVIKIYEAYHNKKCKEEAMGASSSRTR